VSYARISPLSILWRGAGGEAERSPLEVEKPAIFAGMRLGKK